MEVCKGQAASLESDMGGPDPDALPGVGGTGRPCAAALERVEHVGIRDAKVRALLNECVVALPISGRAGNR